MHQVHLQLPVRSEEGVEESAPHESATPSFQGTLVVKEQIRRMRGGSQSHLMRCRANDYYVVKFQCNPQGTRILVNELLGTLLAACMGLPTTPVAICYVDEELIRLTRDLCVETPHKPPLHRIPCQPGLHFGSLYPFDPHRVVVFDFLPDKQLRAAKNVSSFLGMLVFDKWTCNVDGRQTIFYQPEAGGPFYHPGEIGRPYQCVIGGPYKTEMIDQGACFNGCEWNFPDAPLRGLYDRYVVYDQVRGLDDFEPWLAKLEAINESVLMSTARTIPPEWYDGDYDALQRLLEQLERRRSRVRELIWETRKARPYAFPSWIERISSVVSTISHEAKEATATNSK